MELRTNPNDDRSDRLAQWIREMDLADQVFITSTTLVFEDIRLRRDSLPVPYDEANLREGTPARAHAYAIELADAYAEQPAHSGEDGIDEHWRISNMSREIAERIAKYHPGVLGGYR